MAHYCYNKIQGLGLECVGSGTMSVNPTETLEDVNLKSKPKTLKRSRDEDVDKDEDVEGDVVEAIAPPIMKRKSAFVYVTIQEAVEEVTTADGKDLGDWYMDHFQEGFETAVEPGDLGFPDMDVAIRQV